MTTAIADVNQKGGVGKTTGSINLAAALARLEPDASICLVDFDPQGAATEGVGLKDLYDQDRPSLFDALVTKDASKIDPSSFVCEVPHERFFMMPGNVKMLLAELELAFARRREYRLADVLAATDSAFDWVIIDCPPNLGLLTDNAIIASQKLVVPVQAEQTSVRALELLFDQVQSLERELHIKVDILTLVPNLVQDSTLAQSILKGMRRNLPVTPFNIPKRVVLQEAYAAGRSIFSFEPDRAKREDARALRDLYLKLAQLVKEKAHGRG